jgi:hypothetical protein
VGTPTPTTSGALEVFVRDELVHSKLGGDGYVDSPEKIERILAAVGNALGVNAS